MRQPSGPGWKYGAFGPGGGSVPYNVFTTGAIAPFNPLHARHDIRAPYVQDATRLVVGHQPGFTPTGPPTPGMIPPGMTPMPAPQAPQSPNGGPPAGGTLKGATPEGRPVRAFQMTGNPNAIEARQLAAGARRVARIMYQQGLTNLPGELVGGPIASLSRGEAAVLKWPNGVVVGVGP